jgi:hypothetical protein
MTLNRNFDQTLDLDLGLYWNLSTLDVKGVHEMHERLKEIRDELKKWTSGSRGILALSPDDAWAERERLEQLRELTRAARAAAASSVPPDPRGPDG